MSAYELRDLTLNIDALTMRDAQFIISEIRKINTTSRIDIRAKMRAEVRCILEEVARGDGDPYAARRVAGGPQGSQP